MPSVEYTQSKGLVQKSSTDATLNLQGEIIAARKKVETLADASHQLTIEDSGKELLLGRANGQTILLPAVAGVKTDLKLTAQRQFTEGTTIDFDAFGRKFKLQVVANNGALTGKRINAAGNVDAAGDRFAVRDGGNNDVAAGTVLQDLFKNGAEDFTALANVTVSNMAGAAFTIIAAAEGAVNNGTVTISEAADLVLDDAPTNGQDVIAEGKGLHIRLVVGVALDASPTVVVPTDRLDAAAGGNTQGEFVGTVLFTGAHEVAAGDTMTIDHAKETVGDYYEFICDGAADKPKWYVSGVAKTDNAATFA